MSKLSSNQQKIASAMAPSINSQQHTKTQKQDLAKTAPNHTQDSSDNSVKNYSGVYANKVTKSPNGRRSVDSKDQRPPSIDTNSSFFSKKTDTTSRSRVDSQNFQLRAEEDFKCPHCPATDCQTCQTCGGNGTLNTDSTIIKFLSYVIQFKLGKQPSYRPSHPLAASCANPPSSAQALRRTQPARISSERSSLRECKNQCPNIHYGYFCNSCNNDQPIRGTRYHCLICEDYDLCEQCHNQRGHRHIMNQIQISPSYRHSLNCWDMMKQKQEMASQIGMKALHGRIAQLQEKIYSSSIR